MTEIVRKVVFAGAAAAALFCGSPSAWAQAAAPVPPPGVSEVAPVEIIVPRRVTGSHIVTNASEWRMSVRVPYGDLDLQSPVGVAELNRRVDEAADYVCERLEDVAPGGEPGVRLCAREAVRDARPQVAAARGR